MLFNFKVENFRSYREEKIFSMVASPAKYLPQNLIFLPKFGLNLIKVAALYGPNASGKSNLLAAMNFLSDLLGSPVNRDLRLGLASQSFALDRTLAAEPSRFAATFLIDEVIYQYKLAVRGDVVVEEQLVASPRGRPQVWFERNDHGIDFNPNYCVLPASVQKSDPYDAEVG